MSELSVQVKEGKIRNRASFLGKVVQRAAYGSRVKLVKTQGSWMQVEFSGSTGWMHKSALTKKKIVLKANASDVRKSASDDEVVLAGKGFNAEIEKNYRQKNPAMNFAQIDKMERVTVSPEEVSQFLKDGGLS